MHGLQHKRLVGDPHHSTTGESSQRGSANTQRGNANSQVSNGEEDSNDAAYATTAACADPPKRGRKKRSRTELRLHPNVGKVQLEPKGSMQFTYVNYNPKGYKYGSQVGVVLRRLYQGVVTVRDEGGGVIAKRAAYSWNDYTWGKHDNGLSHAKLVKHEFWNLFTVSRQHRRKAERNLNAYLVKRVSDMMHQARLNAVKLYFELRKEECDDTRARTILLTEEEYLKCKLEWCTTEVWRYLCRYWTSHDFVQKRRRAQESRMKAEEYVAQNRGGSRPWGQTQQFLEYKYGSEKAGTLNTYAIMKSGMKNVDACGNSVPIPSQKAKNRLDTYKAGVGLDNNSKELDGKVLYSMEGGLRHDRVPIGNSVADKDAILAAAKSKHVQPSNTIAYQSVVEENEQLRDRNEHLMESNDKRKETNGMLIEENGVNHELILRIYSYLEKETPTDLLNRLADIDARRHQKGCHLHGMDNNGNGNDDDNDEHDLDMHNNGSRCNDMYGNEGSINGEESGSSEEMEE